MDVEDGRSGRSARLRDGIQPMGHVTITVVILNNVMEIWQVGMLQCTIWYDTMNANSVSYDMGSANALNRWIM